MEILGIDIDGCLTGHDYECGLYSKHFKKVIKPYDLKGFDLVKSLGITDKEEEFFWKKYAEDFYRNVDIDYISTNNIINISKNYDKIIILTKRDLWADKITEDWLVQVKNLGLNYDKLVITGDLEKDKFIDDLGLTGLIEDNGYLTNRLAIKRPEIKTYLVDRCYNLNDKSTFRIKSNYKGRSDCE